MTHWAYRFGAGYASPCNRQRASATAAAPPTSRRDVQSQFIRDAEISPQKYYPEGYHPQLMPWWPSDKPIFLPEALVPEQMKKKPK